MRQNSQERALFTKFSRKGPHYDERREIQCLDGPVCRSVRRSGNRGEIPGPPEIKTGPHYVYRHQKRYLRKIPYENIFHIDKSLINEQSGINEYARIFENLVLILE